MPDEHDDDHATLGRDRPPTGTEPVSVGEAARRLRVSKNAVIQRRKRGTLYARNDGGTWLYWIPTDSGLPGRDRPRTQNDRLPPTAPDAPTDRPATGDISALVGLVDRLARENAELHATAAVYQERNRLLEERLVSLEARVRTPATDDGAPQETAGKPSSVAGDARSVPTPATDTRASSRGFFARLRRKAGLG